MIYLVSGLELELRQWMGQPPSLSKSAARRMMKSANVDGRLLCQIIYDQLELRYLSRSRRSKPSTQNWRWTQNDKLSEVNVSEEVNLEKKLIRQCSADWANAIPTASGLFGDGGRKANIDLAVKHESEAAFMELKWASNHPVYAAFELIGYAMAWVQARVRATEMGYLVDRRLRPALDFAKINWCVVAPARFYDPYSPLDPLERALDVGLREFVEDKLKGAVAAFRFVTLPEGVDPMNPDASLMASLRTATLSNDHGTSASSSTARSR